MLSMKNDGLLNRTVRHGALTPTDSNAIWEHQPMTIYHIHHIIPRHMGGSDDPSNLIQLTVEEHAEAHRKLWEEHGNEYDRAAWLGLSSLIGRKEILSIVNSERMKRLWKDPEYREKQSSCSKISQNNPDVKQKKSEATKSLWCNPEYRKKQIERMNTPEYKEWRSSLAKARHEKRRIENPPIQKPKKDKSAINRKNQYELLSNNTHNFQIEENKKKLSKCVSESNKKRIGYKWWNNGVKNKQSKECPGEGWILGKIGRKNQHV